MTASEFSVSVPWFDPVITICGDPFTKGMKNELFKINVRIDADHVPNGICYQDDDVWSLWLGLSGMLIIQGWL